MDDETGVTAEAMLKVAEHCRPWKKFGEFIRWLDETAQRLPAGAVSKPDLLSPANAALASWPDAARSTQDDWFMNVEPNAGYEYGVNATSTDLVYLGFKKRRACWLLPLCRAVYFHEAETIFRNLECVQDCAVTFQDVPLTAIHVTGGMREEVFEAFLAWAITRPLSTLTVRDYSTSRNSVSNLTDSLKKRLEELKARQGLS